MTDTFKTPIGSVGAAAARRGKKRVEKNFHALEKLEVRYVPIDHVSPNDYNPNRQSQHDFELLVASITEYGFTQPIVVVRTEPGGAIDPAAFPYTIVDGEHRWRAARHLGMAEIPVAVAPMNLAQAKIATLRHNRARGSEDIELTGALLRELESLGALDWAADSLNLDDADLRILLDDVPAPELLAADDFSEAWEPDAMRSLPDEARAESSGQEIVQSTTVAAADAVRVREARIAAARTEEERRAIRRDNDVYRIALVFQAEEAIIVKRVLGETPAQTILALCRRADPNTTVAGEPSLANVAD